MTCWHCRFHITDGVIECLGHESKDSGVCLSGQNSNFFFRIYERLFFYHILLGLGLINFQYKIDDTNTGSIFFLNCTRKKCMLDFSIIRIFSDKNCF